MHVGLRIEKVGIEDKPGQFNDHATEVTAWSTDKERIYAKLKHLMRGQKRKDVRYAIFSKRFIETAP